MGAYTGAGGHCGFNETKNFLSSHCFWLIPSEDIRFFVQSCIHCVSTRGEETVPRPFGPAMHGTQRNDLIQSDCVEFGASRSGEQYVILVGDDHSAYCWLYLFESTSAAVVPNAMVDWNASFGTLTGLMSDGPTQF